MKVAIRRVSLSSLAKFGCMLGVVAAILPSLLCGLLGFGLVRTTHRWLAGWQEFNLNVLGQELVRLDFVQILHLEKLFDALQIVTAASVPLVILVIFALALLGGAVLAIIIASIGLAYNLLARGTGGLVVEMAAIKPRKPRE